jgi:hypothetical protein
MIDRILGIASIRSKTIGPMALGSVPVIETGGIVPAAAVEATATTIMGLHCHPVSQLKLIHSLT